MTLTLLSPMADSNPARPATFFPTVSVIVPVYNGEYDLPNLINCLLQQTYPADRVEYLVVDNGSCDRTPELLATAVQTAKGQGLTLKYLTEHHIQSAYAARNTGIRHTRSEILAFTDADCNPQPTWLAQLVQGFQDDTVGIVAGAIVALPGQSWLEKYAERKNFLNQEDTLANSFCPYGQTANLAIRRKAFEAVGLFRPRMTTGGDADICWRIQRASDWRLIYTRQAIVAHRHRTTLKALKSQWYRYGQSNRYLNTLYGAQLTRPLQRPEILHTLIRWILKELPITASKFLFTGGSAIDIVISPLSLYCAHARTQGQLNAQLLENETEIEWLADHNNSVQAD